MIRVGEVRMAVLAERGRAANAVESPYQVPVSDDSGSRVRTCEMKPSYAVESRWVYNVDEG
jgi:hypothetical protein